EERQRAAAEAAAERKARSLIMAIHLFEADAHHGAVRLIADEELVGKWPEFAGGQVAGNAGRRLTHLAIGEIDGRRLKLRNLLGLDHHSTAALRLFWPRAHCARGSVVPFVANRM